MLLTSYKHGGNMHKKAFTLAEVLITLGIIGIVAAMTLPTVVNKYQERVTVTKVKKFYSLINQVLLFAIKDNGYVDEWDYIEYNEDGETISDKFVEYLKPYLKITKDCGAKAGCIASGIYKEGDGANWHDYDSSKKHYKMILADGSYMWLRRQDNITTTVCDDEDGSYKNVCGGIWIDINGKKPPNMFGQDTFFFIVQKNRVMPAKHNDCYIGKKGWGCANHIIQNGDMKYPTFE